MQAQQLEYMTQPCPPQSTYVLGVRVDRLSQQQALDRIELIIAGRRAAGNVILPCRASASSRLRQAISLSRPAVSRHPSRAQSSFASRQRDSPLSSLTRDAIHARLSADSICSCGARASTTPTLHHQLRRVQSQLRGMFSAL